MKTITMDYDTYIQELRDAKESGLKLLPQLTRCLGILINNASGYGSRDTFDKATIEIRSILIELEKVEKAL